MVADLRSDFGSALWGCGTLVCSAAYCLSGDGHFSSSSTRVKKRNVVNIFLFFKLIKFYYLLCLFLQPKQTVCMNVIFESQRKFHVRTLTTHTFTISGWSVINTGISAVSWAAEPTFFSCHNLELVKKSTFMMDFKPSPLSYFAWAFVALLLNVPLSWKHPDRFNFIFQQSPLHSALLLTLTQDQRGGLMAAALKGSSRLRGPAQIAQPRRDSIAAHVHTHRRSLSPHAALWAKNSLSDGLRECWAADL